MEAGVNAATRAASTQAARTAVAEGREQNEIEAGVNAAKARAAATHAAANDSMKARIPECKPAETGGTKNVKGGDDEHLTGLELDKIVPGTKTQRSYNKRIVGARAGQDGDRCGQR